MFPEETEEGYYAAARMGAGVIECDVTFTKDRQLVCRHSQCDMHSTTDVVLRPELNAKCTIPWTGNGTTPMCCTSDFTLAEIKSVCAKMDGSGDPTGTAEEYVYGNTPDWRTDLYSYGCPPVLTHIEYIHIVKSLGGKFTPELKGALVPMPFEGNYTQEVYAQAMIDDYISMGIPPADVFPQSFNDSDIFYWVKNTDYGAQAVALDGNDASNETEFRAWHLKLQQGGAKIVAPPMFRLVQGNVGNFSSTPLSEFTSELGIYPSAYAQSAKDHALDIITWTLERSPPNKTGDYYWSTLDPSKLTEGDEYSLLYVLAYDVGIIGIFSDWAATVTFFANCMDIMLRDKVETSGGYYVGLGPRPFFLVDQMSESGLKNELGKPIKMNQI